MRRLLLLILIIFLPVGPARLDSHTSAPSPVNGTDKLYIEAGLDGIVDRIAFEQAFAGYEKIGQRKKDVLVVVDFTKPSTDERFYVIDVKRGKLLYVSHVSHGKNSGENYATSFSNVSGSHKSSLGFYLTEGTYTGRNGYSLLLDGLEKGINDLARERAIVIHGAAYSNPSVIAPGGRLGRSHGCPALPEAVSRPIIDAIKGGAVLYIYANDNNYLARSSFLSAPAGSVRTAAL